MSDAYDMIDRFLRNNLGSDDDYAEYSKALDSLCGAQPAQAGQVLTDVELAALMPPPDIDGSKARSPNAVRLAMRAVEQAVLAKRVPHWRDIETAPKDGSIFLCWAAAAPVAQQPPSVTARQEPVAWRTFDGEGGYDYRTYDENEDYADEWDKRNPNHKGWVEPLYAAPVAQQHVPEADCGNIDWKAQYEHQKRRAERWIAKYEADIGPLEKAGPVAQQPQEIEVQCPVCNHKFYEWPNDKQPQAEAVPVVDRVYEAAKRLVDHADFQLGGVLSAKSKARDIPSNAASKVKARHLASLRDALAKTPQQAEAVPSDVVRDAVAAEREACAALAQGYAGQVGDVAWAVAAAIRGRGNAALAAAPKGQP